MKRLLSAAVLQLIPAKSAALHGRMVTDLASRFTSAHGRPQTSPVSTVELLRSIIVSLVGLIFQRIAETDKIGSIPEVGKHMNATRWEKLKLFGAITSMTLIASERILTARG